MRIARAFCVEIGEIVTIDAARRHYCCRFPVPRRYQFYCSSPLCRQNNVKVTGVNYTRNAQDSIKIRSAHFRADESEKHHQTCEWISKAEILASHRKITGETEEQYRQRILRRKFTDFVTEFDPRPFTRDDDAHQIGTPAFSAGTPLAETPDIPPQDDGRDGSDQYSLGRTRDLERLVETFREAKEKLTEEEFSQFKLHIVTEGWLPISAYFRHIKYCNTRTGNRVIYGGAYCEKLYGDGFRLRFIDQVDGKYCYLYIDGQRIKNYRFGQYLSGIVKQVSKHRYLTVYAMGALHETSFGKNINLEILELRHLVLLLGPARSEEVTVPEN